MNYSARFCFWCPCWDSGGACFADSGVVSAASQCQVNAVEPLPLWRDRERWSSGRSRSAGLGPRGDRALSASSCIGTSSAGEQRENGLGGVRVRVKFSEGPSDEKHRRDLGSTWVWFLSLANALQEGGRVALLPAADSKVAEAGQKAGRSR